LSAVAAFAGPGSYAWDGTTLTWTATADNQLPGLLNITLGATDDATVEGNEDFTISIANPGSTSGASTGLGTTTAVTTTITDNDMATVSIAPTTDGNETGPIDGVFTVSITSPSATDTVVSYAVAGSASSGSDFTTLTGQVTIIAGTTSTTIDVTTLDDGLVEGTEDLNVTLTGIVSGDPSITIGGTSNATINLLDNDAASWTISGDASVTEAANASYTVALSGTFQNGEDASVNLLIANVDTTSSDYADFDTAVTSAVGNYAGPGTYAWDGTALTWTANGDGQTPTALTISLGATDDAIVEENEDYTISLANAGSTTGAVVNLGATTAVTTTITDNDVATVSVAATTDGDETGPIDGVFTVSITSPSSTDTIIDYTLSGSADSGIDYTPVSGQVTILAGDTTAIITIPTIDDTEIEGIENVDVTLIGIASGDPQVSLGGTTFASLNLLDNDAGSWTISGDPNVNEGASASYTVLLSGTFRNGQDASVDLSLTDIDTASSDYADFNAAVASAVGAYAGPGSYTWDGTSLTWTANADNQIPAGLTISLGATDDLAVEGNEDFTISLANPASSTGAVMNLGATTAVTTTIFDNDAATVSITATADGEETGPINGQFTVTLSTTSATDTVIDYAVSGTATGGSDFTPLSGQVTILAGETTATIDVATIDDAMIEGDENVNVALTGIAAGDPSITIGGTSASINLVDNDAADWTITGDAAVAEGANASYAIALSGTFQNGEVATVDLTLANIDTASSDYADFDAAVSSAVSSYAGPGSYTWSGTALTWTADADNQTAGSLNISLGANDDAIVESSENYSITLTAPTSATGAAVNLGTSTSVTTTITDNDVATVSIVPTTDANEAGLVNGEITVTLSSAASSDTVIDYILGGTATSGSDFAAVTGQVTISAGSTTATISIPTIDDSTIEGIETVTAALTGIASGDPEVSLGGTTSASINMLDNDAASWTISGDATVTEGANASYAVALGGVFQNGESVSIDLAIADVDTTGSDYADFNAAVTSAVAAYAGPGSYSWDGTSLTFTADADNQTAGDLNILLGAIDDVTVEGDEDFTISLANPASTTGASVNLGAATAVTTTITDNDAATASVIATNDGDETGLVNGVFTVTLSTTSATDTVIDYTVAGTATSGTDFTPVTGQVTILAGDSTATIDIPTIDDGLVEGTETVSLTLTGIASGDPSIVLGGTTSASVDLFDNDAATWTITGDASVTEGVNASYNVNLSGSFQNGESASVDLAITDIDTTSSDYADFNTAVTSAVANYAGPGSYAWSGTALTWTAHADNQTPALLGISLGANDDAIVEANEDYSISLSNAGSTTGASVGLGANISVTTTITDNDVATVSIASTTNGDETGTIDGVFTVSITTPSSTNTAIDYVVGGTATSGNDFTPLTGQVTILAGETIATITVPTIDDSQVEGTENISVALTGIASGDADISLGGITVASVDLLDNDSADWTITGDASVDEGASANYAVSLSGAFQIGETATVDLAIADVDTTSTDYADFDTAVTNAVSAYVGPGSFGWDGTTLTFTADTDNQTAGDLNISLGTVDDVIAEASEDYSISLSNPGSTTGAATNLGATTSVTTTITDNDSATVSVSPTTDADEAGTVDGEFTVALSSPASTDTVIDYVVGGSAISGVDYAPQTGQVTIIAGSTTATITIPTIDDSMVEGMETVSVTLTGIASGDPSVVLGATTSAAINMLDDDAADWTISGDSTVTEGANASYAVALGGTFQNGESVSVDLAIADIDTTSSDYADFDAAVTNAVNAYTGPGNYSWDSTSLTWTADADNQSAATLNIVLGTVDDATLESSEDYSISLSNPASTSGAAVSLGASSSVTTTIDDNDTATVTIAPTADGFETGSVSGQFTVSISSPSNIDTVIDYSITGTATSGNDFTALTGQVTILAGDTTATIDVPTIDDALAEPTETLTATLTGITSGDGDISLSGATTATINLIDNDTVTWSITGDASVLEGATANYVIQLAGLVPNGEAISVDVSLADASTDSSDYADFNAAVTSAVGSYAGPGSYNWNGASLTWAADADNQAPSDLIISLGATDDSLFEGNEDFDINISNGSSLVGATADIDSVLNSVNTTITDNDSRPTTANHTVSTDEELPLTFAVTDFPFADADIADSLQSVTITTLPTAGVLTLGGIAVTPGQIIPAGQIGTLVFTSVANENGIGYATFGFTVSDGTNSSDPAVMTIDVQPVNDAPQFNTLDDAPTFIEGGAAVVLDGDATISDIELDAIDNYDGATVTLARNGGPNTDDVFGSSGTLAPLTEGSSLIVDGTSVGIVTTNSLGTLQLMFNTNATSSLVDSVLQQITYSNSNDTPPASVTIDFTLNDGNTGSQGSGGALTDLGSITVTTTPVNDAPTATDNVNSVTEDTSPTVSGNMLIDDDGFGIDSDLDLFDTMSISDINGVIDPTIDVVGTYGSLDWASDGSYTYSLDNGNPLVNLLDDGESLTDTFTYTLTDGNGGTDTATLTITVVGTNDGPIAVDDSATITEDVAPNPISGSVLPNDSDPDDEPLTVTLVDGIAANVGSPLLGTFGSLTLNSNGSFNYTLDNSNPTVDAMGDGDSLTESFTYTISDGDLTATATLTVTILGTNEPPVAVDNTNTVVEDAVAPVTGDVLTNDSDPESDPLTVNGVNGIAADVGIPIPLTYGTITLHSDGSYSYTLDNTHPAVQALPPGETIIETITYTTSDGLLTDDGALVITIVGANDIPQTISPTDPNTPMNSPVPPLESSDYVTDVDTGDAVTYNDGGSLPPGLDIDPITGQVTGTPITPGSYPVTITVTDTNGGSNLITFNWIVTNTPPLANPDSNFITEDSGTPTVSGNIRGNDSDAEDPTSALLITSINGVSTPGSITGIYGTITFDSDGSYTYTLDDTDSDTDALPDGVVATETFTYQITDTAGATSTGNLTINVTGTNDVPIAVDDTLTTDEDTPSSDNVISNDIDVDTADTLTVVELNGNSTSLGSPMPLPSGAIVALNPDGTYTYDPNNSFNALSPGDTATDSFTYTITDSNGQTSSATVTVTILGRNNAPIATDDSSTTTEDLPIVIDVLGNDTDSEGDLLTVNIATPPANGTTSVQPDGTIEYTPNPAYIGPDAFEYTITDPDGEMSTATVNITVETSFFYSFDSFNNFLENDGEEASTHRDVLLSMLIPSLAPEPILAGYAQPGTVLVGRLYDADGSILAETTTTVDQAGNWVLQFFGAKSAPETFVVIEHVATESVALGTTNFRLTPDTYRSMQLNTMHDRANTMGTILSDTPTNALMSEHLENVNPLSLLD